MPPVPIVVDSRVRVPLSALPEAVAEELRARFTHDNPSRDPKPGEPAVYRTWRHEDADLALPRGGMARVREVLRAHALTWAVEDRRTWAHPEPDFPDHLRVERPYQTRLREAAETRENCILHGSTGSGKTTVLYSLLARLKRRSLVMVWNGALLRQWRERAETELGMCAADVGLIQGTTERIEPLTLCMQQTIASRVAKGDRSLFDAFDVFAYDEVQRAPASTSFAAIDPFSARYRIGVSADSSRVDQLEFLGRDLFGDVAAEIGEEETIAAGATVDVEILVVPTSFLYRPNYSNPQWYKYMLDRMVADEERNALALKIAARQVAAGEQVLLFTHRVEHALSMDSRLVGMGIRSGCLLGGADNRVAFERAVAGFKSGDLRAGVGTYQAIAQGLDLPSVSRGICLTPIGAKNHQQLGQVRGRICRSSDGKDVGRLVYLLDPMFGRKPVRAFLEKYRTVKVLSGAEWVEARHWLKASGDRAA